MEFEWDEEKRRRTLALRGLDFRLAGLFFDGRPTVSEHSPRDDEDRWRTVALINGRFHTLIWTLREDTVRVVTMRRAHVSEERAYRALHG